MAGAWRPRVRRGAAPRVVLIGPVCVGKSTTGALLAERLAVPHL